MPHRTRDRLQHPRPRDAVRGGRARSRRERSRRGRQPHVQGRLDRDDDRCSATARASSSGGFMDAAGRRGQARADGREPVHDGVHAQGRGQGTRRVRGAVSRHDPRAATSTQFGGKLICQKDAFLARGERRVDRHRVPETHHDRPVRRRRLHHAEARRRRPASSCTRAAPSSSASSSAGRGAARRHGLPGRADRRPWTSTS